MNWMGKLMNYCYEHAIKKKLHRMKDSTTQNILHCLFRNVFNQTCVFNMNFYFVLCSRVALGVQCVPVADIKQINNLCLQTLIHSDESLIALSP